MPPRHSRDSLLGRSPLGRADEVAQTLNATGRALYYLFAVLIFISAGGLLLILNNSFLKTVPARGGSYSEGIVGTPRFINPVLALSDADHDLTTLVYSGLLKPGPDGSFVPDLAKDWSVSPDGKTYTVHLRPDAQFQDGTPVTADDVVFTVTKALDPAIKSPLRANWDGVMVSAPDAHTVQFTLPKAYAPFVQNLTMGILPKHLWQNISADEFPFSDLNTNPVGSGPYKIENIARSKSGIPQAYVLSANPHYVLGEPYITHFTLRFYENETDLVSALQGGDVEGGSGISPANVAKIKNATVLSIPLSRVFGVFFNQNQNAVLQDSTVRQALSDAVNRDDLIQSVLAGYGTAIKGPIPPSLDPSLAAATTTPTALTFSTMMATSSTASSTPKDLPTQARDELLNKGWDYAQGVLTKTTGSGKTQKTEDLSLTLTTGNVPELTAAAQYLKTAWERMGATVDVQVFDQGDLSENVIRPRKYDALLFGEIVGRGLDLFAFWDSSQRNDPGLNIALYANSSVDDLLAQLRQAQSESGRQDLYQQITDQINADSPAVFLYSPDFIYVVPPQLKGISLSYIDSPSDRFNDVEHWYLTTDHVWNIFAH